MSKGSVVGIGCLLGVALIAGGIVISEREKSEARRTAAALNEAVSESAAIEAIGDAHAARAEALFAPLLSKAPKNSQYCTAYAHFLCRVDQVAKCRAELVLAIQLDRTNIEAQASLGTLDDQSRTNEMMRQARVQLDLNADAARLQHEALGDLVYEQARLQRSNDEAQAQHQASLQGVLQYKSNVQQANLQHANNAEIAQAQASIQDRSNRQQASIQDMSNRQQADLQRENNEEMVLRQAALQRQNDLMRPPPPTPIVNVAVEIRRR